ncbi:histidine phosphatase family protein [Paenibacillus sp. 102]|uniref:histidine phosphatase family protein n=1 Tax=Paenibacillus sp. 102 TaxID=3120823 RepID=UPI0031BA2631
MLTIYLVRHGETQWNTENRLQGWKNSPLTEKGIRNAKLLGKRLSNIEFCAVYSSPNERTIQTAKYICSGRNIPIITDENLKEISYGEWEGKTKEEIEKNFKKEYFHYWNAPHLYDHRPHKGEGINDLKKRVENVLNKILAENPSGNVLIVSHAATIKALLLYTMNISTEKMWDPPFIYGTSLTVFHWDGKRFLFEMVGDTSHFEEDI